MIKTVLLTLSWLVADGVAANVAAGCLDVRNHGDAPMVFVHRGNRLGRLTLPRLEIAFGADNRPGPRCASTWDQPGATGAGGGYLPVIARCVAAEKLKTLD